MSKADKDTKRRNTLTRKLKNVLRSNGLRFAKLYAERHGLAGQLAQLESKRKV